mmetsp:Transcript_23493/g.45074  ORF Transcript_23493/g.45074 Transcript_23493/m.45074 type:complete len:461 (-) Transcript_23493:416-1798(-)
MSSFAANTDEPCTDSWRASVHKSFLMDAFESKCDENANGFKTGGAVSCALLNREGGPEPEQEAATRRATIFTTEVEESIEDPESRSYWGSHQGTMMMALLIFVYMHFDAGLPILQELYKINYGNSTDWSDDVGIPDPVDKSAGGKHKLFYTKQTLLITQNFFEIICIFLVATLLRGSPRDCISLRKTVKFAPAGACFGIQAVFGFFAMEEMGADAYSLYAQTSIIVLTLAWSIIFRIKLPGTAWCGIFAIAIGMVGFKMSDANTSFLGLVFISLKILTQCFACIYAEMFVKTDPESLYIQMAWIKPVELLITCVMTFVMSNIFPQRSRLYNRNAHEFQDLTPLQAIWQLGYFHHWNWLTVIIMVFNMGDTFMTATVAKKFDSVVKGVAGVADIIYPTQVLMYFIATPDYTPLMVISGSIIIIGSLNFVLAKGAMRRSAARKEEITKLRKEVAIYAGYNSA